MAIRSIGAKALQQNKADSVVGTEPKFVATNSIPSSIFGETQVGPNKIVTNKIVTNKIVTGKPKTSMRRFSRRMIVAGCLGLVVVGSTGCSMTAGLGRSLSQPECIDDFMIAYRNKAMAEKAWHCRKDRFRDQCFENEFKDGFLAGYSAVAEGGAACTPAVAPSQYWGWRYQSASGQGAVNAWFQGFPEGARAAEEDGIGNWRHVGFSGPQGPAGVPAGQPLHTYSAPQEATLSPVPGTMVPGTLVPGTLVPGTLVPGTMAPTNPFLNNGELAPAVNGPVDLDINAPSDLNSDATDLLDSANRNETDDSFREVVTSQDIRFDVDRAPAARTASKGLALSAPAVAVNDQTDFDVERIFGSSAGSTSASDDGELPFSFE